MREMRNILLVANFPSDVGYAWWLMENFWSEISRFFRECGRESVLLYPKINKVPPVVAGSPIRIIEHDFGDRTPRSIMALLRLVRCQRIGYVYLTDRPHWDWLYVLLRLAGVKRIIDHDHSPGERAIPSLLMRLSKKCLHRLQLFSCDHYIAVSDFVRRRMLEVSCLPQGRCSCVHNGIKLFDGKRTSYAHDHFGIPAGAKIVVSTGRATFYKGIDVLLECARILVREKGADGLYFLHIGGGPDLDRFREIAVRLEIAARFVFAGFREDVALILPSCHIGVQASHGEAFSLSILEYLCAGLATVAPNNCGNSEAIDDGSTGLLFTPGDASDLADKILFLLRDEQEANRIGEEARKSVLRQFTIERCNQQLVSLLAREFASPGEASRCRRD